MSGASPSTFAIRQSEAITIIALSFLSATIALIAVIINIYIPTNLEYLLITAYYSGYNGVFFFLLYIFLRKNSIFINTEYTPSQANNLQNKILFLDKPIFYTIFFASTVSFIFNFVLILDDYDKRSLFFVQSSFQLIIITLLLHSLLSTKPIRKSRSFPASTKNNKIIKPNSIQFQRTPHSKINHKQPQTPLMPHQIQKIDKLDGVRSSCREAINKLTSSIYFVSTRGKWNLITGIIFSSIAIGIMLTLAFTPSQDVRAYQDGTKTVISFYEISDTTDRIKKNLANIERYNKDIENKTEQEKQNDLKKKEIKPETINADTEKLSELLGKLSKSIVPLEGQLKTYVDAQKGFTTFIYIYGPRMLLSIAIEFLSLFFLKLYKESLSEYKYYCNELTNMQAKIIALEASLVCNNNAYTDNIIESLVKTERNYILKKGQSTVELEKQKLDSQSSDKAMALIEKVTGLVKKG